MLDASVCTLVCEQRSATCATFYGNGCLSGCWKCQNCQTFPTELRNGRTASAALSRVFDTNNAVQDDEAPAAASEGLQEATTETPSSMESPSTPSEMDAAG